jgi:ATP-dependent DNA helicase DinG
VLAQDVAAAFARSGPLAAQDAAYRPREAQLRMAQAVAEAIAQRESLVVEAGTGVGKTFAYLVPLLLAGQRALVSTATKALQDQLFLRDLPRLRDALRIPVRLALLKGRSSYLCRWRLQEAALQASLPDRFAVRALHRVQAWAQATRSGDMAELEGLDERSPVIPLVTSTRDNCLGSECPEYSRCHLMQARREAMAADMVVVNHHLFFADLSLRDTGVAELLPTVDAAVFDEAHQLPEAGVNFLGSVLSTGQALEYSRDLLGCGLQHARGLQAWQDVAAALEQAARELRLQCAGGGRELRGSLKLSFESRAQSLLPPLQALRAAAAAAAEAAEAVAEAAPDFAKLAQRGHELAALCAQFAMAGSSDEVRWIDIGTHQARLVQSPLDIRAMLSEQRRSGPRKAWVFTSATLGDDEALSWFTRASALEDATVLRVGSPFDYPQQARLWVPGVGPLPNDAAHPAAVGALAARLALALQGRTFVLTTTLRALEPIAQALRQALGAAGQDYELLVQGEQPRRMLLQRFGDGQRRVLLGSASFWEGIDVPGDALQCVLIDKLPFPPPNDPLVQARARQITQRGGDAFAEYFVAEAAIALKQGGGRLIRSESDRGLLVVCDPRMRRMPYGKRLRAALPPMAGLANEAEALAWLGELASAHRQA